MKKSAKLLSLVLAVVIMLASFSIMSYAAATPIEAGNSMATSKNVPSYATE